MPQTPSQVKQDLMEWLGKLGFTLIRDDTEVIIIANQPTAQNPDPQAWMEVQNFDEETWNAPIRVMRALNKTGQSKYAMAWYWAFVPLQNKTTPQEFDHLTLAATGLSSDVVQTILIDPAGVSVSGSNSSWHSHCPNILGCGGLAGGQAIIDGTQTLPATVQLWFSFAQCSSCPSGQGGSVLLNYNGVGWVGASQDFCGLPMTFQFIKQSNSQFTLSMTGVLAVGGQTQVNANSYSLSPLLINFPSINTFINGCSVEFLVN